MGRCDIVKLTYFLTDAGAEAVSTYRARRDAWVGANPAPASTLLVVAGLASPAFLVEIDCIAAA